MEQFLTLEQPSEIPFGVFTLWNAGQVNLHLSKFQTLKLVLVTSGESFQLSNYTTF